MGALQNVRVKALRPAASVMLFPGWKKATGGFRLSEIVDVFMACACASVHQRFLLLLIFVQTDVGLPRCTFSINLCAISPRLGCILYTFILIKTLMAAKQMHRWWICRSFGNARCVYSVYFWIQRSICLFLTGGTPLLSLVPPLGLCVSV